MLLTIIINIKIIVHQYYLYNIIILINIQRNFLWLKSLICNLLKDSKLWFLLLLLLSFNIYLLFIFIASEIY